MRFLSRAVLAIGLVSLLAGHLVAAPLSLSTHSIRLTDLGPNVVPTAVNNLGQVVGQNAAGHAFSWANGVGTDLGTLGGAESYANDVNDSGVVVGWSLDGNAKQKAFRYVTTMASLDNVTAFESSAEAINRLGEIVGWKTDGLNFTLSVLWDGGNPNGKALFSSSGSYHKGLGINDDKEIVGIDFGGSTPQGYYYDGTSSASKYTFGLGDDYLPFAGVNNQQLSAGASVSRAHIVPIGDGFGDALDRLTDSDTTAQANGLNDLGLVVGESGNESVQRGFIYDVSIDAIFDVNDFNSRGFEVDSVLRLTDINNNGAFVGTAMIDGVEHGIVGELVPVPEPSTIVLAAIGLCGFFWRRAGS